MTDEAAFERLATAILREAQPEYASLLHPGVNSEDKTVKSPVDGPTVSTAAWNEDGPPANPHAGP